ncbi:hypothetical protein LTR47_007079 [Exophiala xenobiotica]|nr:hypothetical protein LTR47_007079 [Exophiala xenobiotica]KAK5252887.1 hypothetical protein LTS06_002599 [Exophiala xenobiotica]KAK5327367.1 hypothetical protein LTR93_002751 [Exophiala xenobiotica]KAK5353763.1 hypothetical protein LTR61_002457 [Exophiala xenobiotica]KAK5360621.1 hypothetical protein LTS13_010184 [Exophiala xenobiotica]
MTERPVRDNTTTKLSPEAIQFSPFKPYFWFPFYAHDPQFCWEWASCVYYNSADLRKQQFDAVALIMGLIPLTLKDIAWPNRRIVFLRKRLDVPREILVRALGLEPIVVGGPLKVDVIPWWRSFSIFKWTQTHPRRMVMFCVVTMFVGIAGVALTEIYSKRSALGCPYPVFVVTFYVVALLPSAVHVLCARYRLAHPKEDREDLRLRDQNSPVSSILSAVQGQDEWWIVQLFWAIYYVAGTLVYTSIMAVTVPELVVWVCASVALTAACKFTALIICLFFEIGTGISSQGIQVA